MSEVKNVETIDVETTEVNVEAKTKAEGLLSKAKTGLKKHGKKVAAFAAVATVGLIGYALGSKSKGDDSDLIDADNVQYIDTDSASNEVTED